MSGAGDAAWLDLTREEPVDPRRRIIDAHHHLWGGGEGLAGAPPYLSGDLLADMNGHNVVGSVYVEVGSGYRQDGPEELRPVGETEFAAREAKVSASTKAPILGIVSHADLTLGDKVQPVLDAHAAAGGGLFRGIRQLPGGMGRPPRDLLGEAAFSEGVARLGRNGYSLDAFAIFSQLGELGKLANAAHDTVIVLNHLGMPIYRPEEGSRDAVMSVWRDGIREIARRPNIVMKLGGIGMDSMFGMGWSKRERPPTSDEVVAWWGDDIRFCIDTFGPSRCLFESNFPVDRWAVGYTVLWNAFQKIAGHYSEGEQEALFSGTAQRVYRLAPAT
jgi:predicted TIM-barrel fold metal-dependent hydrolase